MYTSVVECFGIQIPVLKVMGLNPIGVTIILPKYCKILLGVFL